MEEKKIRELINTGRDFMKCVMDSEDDDFVSDQQLKKPQPPLVKAKIMEETIKLPLDFDKLENKEFQKVVFERKSSRVFTKENLTLLQLSYLLYASQGIKDIRGKSYATLRLVPCGGARHEFETYLLVQYVEGLKPGRYHYLPMSHSLEYLGEQPELSETIGKSVCGQNWANKASVVFYYEMVAYRAEWRYGIHAHRVALIDLGHVGENLYLACSYLGLGNCGVGAYDQKLCDAMFGLDGQEEFIVYTSIVGTVSEKDKQAEKDFYRFVEEEGL